MWRRQKEEVEKKELQQNEEKKPKEEVQKKAEQADLHGPENLQDADFGNLAAEEEAEQEAQVAQEAHGEEGEEAEVPQQKVWKARKPIERAGARQSSIEGLGDCFEQEELQGR